MKTVTEQRKRELHWLTWGPVPFQQAREQDKLILLDSGATWCHWCHVMDQETYEDEDVIELITDRYIPIRIDRDRLPTVDHYFQQAPAVISSHAGGWPLTVILTPQGHVLYKATFLPPRAGGKFAVQFGLVELLTTLDQQWRENRQQLASAGQVIQEQTAEMLNSGLSRPGNLTEKLVSEIVEGIFEQYDQKHGGFSSAPKFFNCPALELLLARGANGDMQASQIVSDTLSRIARSGIHDQIGGAFHRYSVDQQWHVPHFEKMSYDNANLLKLYANAYALTGNDEFAQITRELVAWSQRVMSAPEDRGFFASQDADAGPGDDGDYYTWTQKEIRQALGDEAGLVERYFCVDETGDIHARPGRNVLHRSKTDSQFARLYELTPETLRQRVAEARRKLLAMRIRRPQPNIDKTIYADLNGMWIESYLTTWQRLGDDSIRDKALNVLDHLLNQLRNKQGIFAHWKDEKGQLQGIGLLSDQAWMMRALVTAYQVTGQHEHLKAAEVLANYIHEHLTSEDSAFLDRPAEPQTGTIQLPRIRNWQDSPAQSPASLVADVLVELAYLKEESDYQQWANQALESFAGAIEKDWGTLVAGYAIAVSRVLKGPTVISIVGSDQNASSTELARQARSIYLGGHMVLQLDPSNASTSHLIAKAGYSRQEQAVAIICTGRVCLRPAYTTEELISRLRELPSLPNR